jgi:predicted Zn-dependent protease
MTIMRKISFVVFWTVLFCFVTMPPMSAEGSRDFSGRGSSAAPSDFDTLMNDVSGALNQMDEAVESSDDSMTPEDEYYLGRAVAAEILKVYKPYTDDPALTAYLNKICLALTINSSMPTLYAGYHVEVLDTDEICAFATPGGHIFLSRGFIACAPSEDALAAVIAHEAAHIQLRHAAAIIQNERTVQDLTASIDRAASIASRDLTPRERSVLFKESITVSVNTLFRDGYSREQEFEADKTAVSLLRSAAYDPAALRELLDILLVRLQSGNLSNTHPSPSLRITSLGNIRSGLCRETLSARRARYEAVLKNLP